MKRWIKKMLRKTECALSVVAFTLSGMQKKNFCRLERLRNAYKGKRCFIICNGPSLRARDLTKIHENGDISIGINAIARIYDQTPWRPTFLSATDDMVYSKKNRELVKNCECGFKIYDRSRFLKSLRAKGRLLYLSFDESLDLLDTPRFSADAMKKLPSIGTSTYSIIEFAVFLGFEEIYLLGCDMSYAVNLNRDGTITYNETGNDHFYGKEKEDVSSAKEKPVPIWQMEVAFEYAARYAREHGLKIYNATRGGRLEYFERVDFDLLF